MCSSDLGSKGDPPISMIQEGDPSTPVTTVPESDPPYLIPEIHKDSLSTPVMQRYNPRIPMAPPPCSFVTSFDWIRFMGYHLPSYVPFEIIVHACNMVVPENIIDEGASVSILSSNTWKALGSPQLVPITQNMLAFNRGTSQPLGILLKLPIIWEGKPSI